MAYVTTTFVDRSVEFPNRRKLTAVPGLADTFDVARAEGTVFAEGTKPDAANLNAEFGKIKTETDSINTSLNEVKTKILARTTLYTGAQVSVGAFDLGIDLSSYDSYEVLCYMSTSGGKTIISSGVIPIGFDAFPCYSAQDRQFTYTVTNSLHAEVGRSNGGTNNTVLSPYKVYGYKTIE